MNRGQTIEDKQKLIQFASILNLLNKGKPMTNYEDFQPLYKFLKLWSDPKKAISLINGAGWE